MHNGGSRFAALVVGVAVVVGGLTLPSSSAQAAETCSAQPATVVVCVPDATVTGVVTVTATVTTASAVEAVRFTWDGANYLVTDHDPPYAMVLDSRRLPGGTRTLTATALVDGADPAADLAVPVANTESPPVAAPFAPRLGTPDPGRRFRLAAVGDGADGSAASLAVVDQIDAWDPDVFAYLGDVYDNGSAFEFDTWYGDATGYGRFRDITNPTIGNHETRIDLGAPYFAFWGQVPHYYSYDVGGWHVVVLDSTTEFAQVTPGTAQYQWLVDDLAAHRGACTLTYLHHPRYSAVSGVGRTGLSQIWSLLHDSGVSMVLAGHAHTYERWTPLDGAGNAAPGGLTQLVVGTGGREIINTKVPEPRVAAQVTKPGALLLELGPDDAAFTFASADGQYTDSGTIPCRQPPPPPPPPDITAPTVPTDVAGRAASPTSADVFWSPSTDATGVAGYTVRRGGVAVATLPAGATTYRDGGLAAERPYSWTVEAFDAAGNRSAPSAPASATTPFPTRSTRTLLTALRRAPEHRRGFTAARFPGWTDADRDGCSTAQEVLLAEALRPPRVGSRCALAGGRWRSPYDGRYRTRSGALVVDHVVPLSEVWQSGAHRWRKALRRQHANDLGYPSTLVAVTRSAAAAKAGREPQDWLPVRAYRCSYVASWVAVKWRWRLAVDPAERRFLVRSLRGCGWPQVRATTRVP